MARYFLTGATGYIGGRIAAQLVSSGHEVVALVRSPEKAAALKQLGVTLAKGDVTDTATLAAPMRGVDGVFHVAGWYKIGPGARTDDGVKINIDGTRNVLETMRDLKISKGVYTSTLAVFSDTNGTLPDERYEFLGTHLSEYDRTKAAAHHLASQMIEAGLPLIIVQPGLVYGPGDTSVAHDTLTQFLNKKLPMLPEKSAYCWGHINDIASAHLLAMERGVLGETYIIAGPPHTLIEAIAIAEKLTGIPGPKRRASPQMLLTLSQLVGFLERLGVPIPEAYSSEFLRVSAGATYLGDNTKAKKALGYAPRSLEEGLKETLAWEQSQQVNDRL
jgi:nucleoside-diphosphate-sugar epimerase